MQTPLTDVTTRQTTDRQEVKETTDRQDGEQTTDRQEVKETTDRQDGEQTTDRQEVKETTDRQDGEQTTDRQEVKETTDRQDGEQTTDRQEVKETTDRQEVKQTTADDVISRRATPGDLPEVMSLGSAYGGRDYMAAIFPRLVHAPEMSAHVHYVDGEFAGFTCGQQTDGGEGVVWRVGRMKEKFRCAGYFTTMVQSAACLARATWPGLQYQAFASTDDVINDVRNVPGFQRNHVQEVYRKRIINRLFHLDDLTIPDLDHDAVTVREMSPADVVHMSTDTAVMHKLFPQGRIFAHSMYLRLVEENLPELISDNAAIFASTTDASGGTQMSPGTQTLGCADGRRLSDADISGIDMISTAYHNMAAIGLQYEMDIQSPSGLRSLPAHLRHHVRAIRQLGAPSGVVMVTISEGLDEAAVEACLATYGLTKHLAHAERHILYFVYRL